MAFKKKKLGKTISSTLTNTVAIAEVTSEMVVKSLDVFNIELDAFISNRAKTKNIRNLISAKELEKELIDAMIEAGYSDEQAKEQITKLNEITD